MNFNILLQLINDYTTDAVVRRLVDTYDWYVIPLLNPDGYNYSHTTVSVGANMNNCKHNCL